jgi:phosphate:Na+ symporter
MALPSAGLLTFPQGLGLVFGANVGTTATGWLVALIGVRVSLTAASLPMIFVGALINLLGRGRVPCRAHGAHDRVRRRVERVSSSTAC